MCGKNMRIPRGRKYVVSENYYKDPVTTQPVFQWTPYLDSGFFDRGSSDNMKKIHAEFRMGMFEKSCRQ